MPYKISGILSDNARIVIIKESGWSIESNTNESSGSYSVDGLETGKKLVLARKSDGEVLAYGNVDPVEYGPDAETKLLLHMDDVGLTDSSIYGHTVTINGDVYRTDAQNPFGTGYSAYFDGTTADYLSIGTSSDFNVAQNEDFVLECWVRHDGIDSVYDTFVAIGGDSDGVAMIHLEGKLYCYLAGVGGYGNDGTVMTNNTWYWLVFARSSNNLRCYVNGTQVGSTVSRNAAATPGAVGIGKGNPNPSGPSPFKGWMAEVRYSVGTDRGFNGSTIPVPTEPYSS
jgi:hypothetical protein